jgi:peptidoglycan/LPS O-acetylase OafA/YrhL
LNSSRSEYIPTLDGWRAIAILLVIFDHGIFKSFRPYGWTVVGGHGVEIFFILSGYLITGKLLEDGSLRRFYTRRAFRILPVLFIYLAIVCVLGFGLQLIPLAKSEVFSSVFFIRNYFVYLAAQFTGLGWFTAHFWSLSIEEQFYLIWPLVLLRMGRGSTRRQMSAAALLFVFWTLVFALVHVARHVHIFGWAWIPNLNYAGLIAGCVLRIARSDAAPSASITRVFHGRSSIFVAITFAYIICFHAHITAVDPLFCGLGVCATLIEPTGAVGRVLELPALRWIGRLSYSLYIWQQLFLGFGVTFRPFGFFSRFPLNLVALLAVACASYYLLERPLLRVGHQLTARNAEKHEPVALAACA